MIPRTDIVTPSIAQLASVLRPLQKLKLLDMRGTCANCRCFIRKLWRDCDTDCIFSENGFPCSLAAQLGHELPECRIRISTCKYCAIIMLHSEDMFNTWLTHDFRSRPAGRRSGAVFRQGCCMSVGYVGSFRLDTQQCTNLL